MHVRSFAGPIRRAPVLAIGAPQPKTDAAIPASCSSAITPVCLQDLYQIPATSVPATTKSTLAVSAFSDQDANKADLVTFLKKFRPDMSSATTFSTTLFDNAVNSQTASNAGVEAVSL